MKLRIQYLFLFVFCLISIKFFDAQFIERRIIEYTYFFATLVLVGLSVKYLLTVKGGFAGPIKLILLAVLLSIPMAYLSWGQSMQDNMIYTVPHFIWILFFLLVHQKLSIRAIENTVLILGILYLALYFFQYANSPTVLFGKSLWGDEFTIDRNVTRIIFPGAGVFILAVFISLSKFTTQKKHRWFWFSMVLLGVIIPIMQVTRQFTAGMLLFYLIHFMRGKNILVKGSIAIFFLVVAIMVVLYSDIPMIEGMIAAQERDTALGSDYIRVQAGKYFLTDFSPSWVNRIFGNGVPNWGFSAYGRHVERLAMTKEYFHSDVGIIAVYSFFGVLAVVGFALIWVKSFTIKVPPKYLYVKYYLWYLLFTSLTWYSVYSFHYLIATVLVLYIYHTIAQRSVTAYTQDGHTVRYFVPLAEDLNKNAHTHTTDSPIHKPLPDYKDAYEKA